jgi:integrase
MNIILEQPTQKRDNSNIINYGFELKKRGCTESTIEAIVRKLCRLNKTCNINEPEQVREILAQLNWKSGTKKTTVAIYTKYLEYINKTWKQPHYTHTDEIPFIPTEQEIDTVIANCTTKTSTFLLLLKETGTRKGEALQAKWTDIDIERKTITIKAEKGSNSRILPISDTLINQFSKLKRTNDKIFNVSDKSINNTFIEVRKRTAERTGNTRFLRIHLHTFRHWKATMEYHKTKDIIHVKQLLGHKSITSTMTYINIEQALYNYNSDEWTTKVAHNIEEETKLIEANFTLVRTINETTAIYKKRK